MVGLNSLIKALESAKEKAELTNGAYVRNVINDTLKICDYKNGFEREYTFSVSALAKEKRENDKKKALETKLEKIEKGEIEVGKEPQKMVYNGFSSHDCESHYKCPVCETDYGSWGFGKAGDTFKCRKCGATLIYPH